MGNEGIAGVLTMLAMCLIVGFLVGTCVAEDHWQGLAKAANVGEWRIDDETGDKEFVFECLEDK